MAPDIPTDGSDRPDPVHVTNEPITEAERGRHASPTAMPADRPGPWLMLAGVVAIAALAIVAALTVGAQYAIPFVVLAFLISLFVGGNRALSARRTRAYPEGRAKDTEATDHEDAIPSFGMDEDSQLGQTSELSDEQQQSHADMEKSTGQ